MNNNDASKLCGQLLTIAFDGPEPSQEVKDFIKKCHIGGIIYFDPNIESPEQTAELSNLLQSIAAKPLFISADQEGGMVARLHKPHFTEYPTAEQLCKEGSPKTAFDYHFVMGTELKAIGVNWDFAPVCDINTNKNNPIIADLNRAFSDDIEEVEKFASGAVRGLQKAGVMACAKHFPGHGETRKDSHLTLPVLDLTLDRLNEVELRPFKKAIKSGVETVMTAHILYKVIDDSWPGTLSKTILQDLLRKECRFEGVIVSDDMNMKGITELYKADQAIVQAVNAGCDHLLYCHGFETQLAAHENLVKAVIDKQIPLSRIEDAIKRMDLLRVKYIGETFQPLDPKEAANIAGCEEHAKVVTIKPTTSTA